MKTLKFNKQMTAAIKEGRKTQARGVLSIQPPSGFTYDGIEIWSAVFSRDDALLQVHFPFQRHNHIDDETIVRITKFQVEHLGDISESDCAKEGIGSALTRDLKRPQFEALWRSIYPTGEKAWRDDLWVWVIDFEVV